VPSKILRKGEKSINISRKKKRKTVVKETIKKCRQSAVKNIKGKSKKWRKKEIIKIKKNIFIKKV
jgi:hypothetical protein